LAVALERDAGGDAELVSITDELVVFGEMGAGFLDLLVFVDATTGLLSALLATGADLAALRGVDFATGLAGFAGFATATDFLAFAVAGALLGAAAFLATACFATAFGFADAAGFFAAADFTTAFRANGLDLATALGFGATDFAAAFPLAFAAGFARAATLPGLAVDLVFFVTFAISVLTL
jgi:hypothetical protein